jgi:hypothetical protein
MLGNKKGAIGSTISWLATTFIIIILMAFLVLFTSMTYKTKGPGSFELESQAAAMGPAELDSFLNYLETPNSDGKTNLDEIKEEDFSFLSRDFYSNSEETKKLIGVDCIVYRVYVNGVLKSDSYPPLGAGGDRDVMIDAMKHIYILSNAGNMVDLGYYGGKCLK